ncbi:hypothetical protein [Halosimplex sp. TS25]|uniref:DUF7344 domain-containing protein n=1 Tax=Halosimplex rarum TaxID=3396619 RepID=UPI0039E87750
MTTDGTKDASRLFDALAHRYRRIALYYLREHETATLDGLVDLVSGWVEVGPGPDEPVDRDAVRAELYHVHLPMLDEADLIEYDVDDRTVALRGYSAAAEEILDAAFEADTTETPLDIEGVLAAAAGEGDACRPGEAACGPDDGAGRGDRPGSATEDGDGG